MAPANILISGLNFTQMKSFSSGTYRFAADRLLVLSGTEAWLPGSLSSFWHEWSVKILKWLFGAEAWLVKSVPLYWHKWSSKILECLSRPDVLAITTVWWMAFATFSVVVLFILKLGFRPRGVAAGSLAAIFQSYVYGAFTPAAGIFATLTSMGMLGTLMVPVAIAAAIFATGVAVLVWKLQH